MLGKGNKVRQENVSEFEKQKALADELDELEREQLRRKKYRLQLLESPEIKELELQLRTAYTRKELQAQIDGQKLEKVKNSVYSDIEKKEFEKSLKQSEEEDLAFKQQQTLAKLEYRKILQDQMMFRYREKEEEHNEMLKERDMLNKAMKTLIEEDKQELEREALKRELSKKEIEDFKQAKAIWLKKEKEIEVDEERRINTYLDKKRIEEEELKKKEKERKEHLIELQNSVANIVSQIGDTREEHARIIQIIVEEQERQKGEQREFEESMKLFKSKQVMKQACIKQIEERLHKLYIDKLEEEDYMKKKMEEYEEDKKYQQMTAQKQKLMKLEYRLSLKREFEEKEIRRKREEEQLLEFKKSEEKAEQERCKLLEEERIRLLQDHAVNVLGFLPPGLLKPSDLPHLPPDVREFYTAKPEPLGSPAR